MNKLSGSAFNKVFHHQSGGIDLPLAGQNQAGEFYQLHPGESHQEKKMEIGFVHGKDFGVGGFNCGNCGVNHLGLCTKYHFGVANDDCCSQGWEPK